MSLDRIKGYSPSIETIVKAVEDLQDCYDTLTERTIETLKEHSDMLAGLAAAADAQLKRIELLELKAHKK